MSIATRVANAIRRRWGVLRQLHWPRDGMWRRTPDGLWMFLRPGDFFDACYAYSSPDEGFRQLARRVVRPGDWAVDAGGQKGWYSMLLARAVGPAGQVLTIEPDPAAAALVQANIHRNRFTNITLVREAAGDAARDVEFHLNEFVGWSSRTPNPLQQASVRQRVMVPMRPLDDMLDEMLAGVAPVRPRVTWLKIDVEGGEAGVLRGATRLLTDHAPLLWIEINPSSLAAAGSSPAELGDLLAAHGYRFWRSQGDQRLMRRSRAWFIPITRLSDVTMEMDVLCVPPSREAELSPMLNSAVSPETALLG